MTRRALTGETSESLRCLCPATEACWPIGSAAYSGQAKQASTIPALPRRVFLVVVWPRVRQVADESFGQQDGRFCPRIILYL